MTPLDLAIKATAETVALDAFGQALRAFNPHRRASVEAIDRHPSLADLEMGGGPPIGRTLGIAFLYGISGAYRLTNGDRAYLQWVAAAHEYLCALTPLFWSGLRPDIYSSFFDWDDVPAFASDYIPQLRRKKTRSIRATVAEAKAGAPTVEAFTRLARAARATPAWETAIAAGGQIARDRRLYGQLMRNRETAIDSLVAAPGTTVGQARDDLRANAGELLAGPTDIERALRRYNLLVQLILASVLGFCERFYELGPVDKIDGPIDAEETDRGLVVHLTAQKSMPFLSILSPFEVALGGPFDGLYICERMTVRFGGRESADLWGLSIRSVAGL